MPILTIEIRVIGSTKTAIMMDEYDKIVQDEIQKAKDADKETNNNIRGNYMRNLGLHSD